MEQYMEYQSLSEALQKLIDMGLVKEVIKRGEKHFELTDKGKIAGRILGNEKVHNNR